MSKSKNVKNKGREVLDENLKSAAGGTVSKLIYKDGRVVYVATEGSAKYPGIEGFLVTFRGGPKEGRYSNRKDAEKYAQKRGWSTDGHTFRKTSNGWVIVEE